MTEPSVNAGETAGDAVADFGGFLRSAGKLAVARQVSALCLIGVVFVLPALTSKGVATDFVWSYFAMLTLTSLLGLGLERLAATVVGARGDDESVAGALAPVLLVRVVTAPFAAVGLWAVLAFVGVQLSTAAWWATMLWIAAGLVGPVLFGALRAAGNSNIEPALMLGVRALQAVVLAALAVAGATTAALVLAVALLETAGAVFACCSLGSVRDLTTCASNWRRLPLRRAFALAGIDVVGLVNLRADLLLVGHMLGAVPGATYGLLYRAVDGFNGVVGSAGVWLYAESANEREGGTDPAGLRARSLAMLPRFGLALAVIVVLAAGAAGEIVPRLAAETDTLRILAAAFPLLTVNAVELHVRSGRGRNREVLAVNTITLAVNVPLSIGLIAAFGLPGAAAALAVSELLQATLLWCSASRAERTLVTRALATAVLGAAFLVLTAGGLATGRPLLVVAGLIGSGLLIVGRARRPVRRPVVLR
jgi:O-antigen/teichoic acid export membrane protein